MKYELTKEKKTLAGGRDIPRFGVKAAKYIEESEVRNENS